MEFISNAISSLGAFAPFACIALFLLASLLVVWRLEVLSGQGVAGTVSGTIFMPFRSIWSIPRMDRKPILTKPLSFTTPFHYESALQNDLFEGVPKSPEK